MAEFIHTAMKRFALLSTIVVLILCSAPAKSQNTKTNFVKKESFIIGVKGITWKENSHNQAGEYIYNTGRKLKCYVFYNQVGIDFQVEDEFGRRTSLKYNFEKVGYNTSDWEIWYPYSDNEYTIGQYDIDGDGFDEIVVAVRTTNMDHQNLGVSINFFDASTLMLKAKVKCTPVGWLSEYQVRIINNNIYFKSLRWAEKYSYTEGLLQSYIKRIGEVDNYGIF